MATAMAIVVAGAAIAAAILWSVRALASEIGRLREQLQRRRSLELLALFTPGIAEARRDTRALLVWEPLARMGRVLFGDAFAELDRAAGSTFPFSTAAIEAAHAQWTADWLAWERTHDADYKQKAADVERELAHAAPDVVRARLDAIEREKLDFYQRRYAEYVRVGKALQTLIRP